MNCTCLTVNGRWTSVVWVRGVSPVEADCIGERYITCGRSDLTVWVWCCMGERYITCGMAHWYHHRNLPSKHPSLCELTRTPFLMIPWFACIYVIRTNGFSILWADCAQHYCPHYPLEQSVVVRSNPDIYSVRNPRCFIKIKVNEIFWHLQGEVEASFPWGTFPTTVYSLVGFQKPVEFCCATPGLVPDNWLCHGARARVNKID